MGQPVKKEKEPVEKIPEYFYRHILPSHPDESSETIYKNIGKQAIIPLKGRGLSDKGFRHEGPFIKGYLEKFGDSIGLIYRVNSFGKALKLNEDYLNNIKQIFTSYLEEIPERKELFWISSLSQPLENYEGNKIIGRVNPGVRDAYARGDLKNINGCRHLSYVNEDFRFSKFRLKKNDLERSLIEFPLEK